MTRTKDSSLDPLTMAAWEEQFVGFLAEELPAADTAHDLAHVRRVVATARRLGELEGADMAVVLPAAWLHDCVVVAKDSADRSRASRLAAAKATSWLQARGYPAEKIPSIAHAIAAHSFSAGIPAETLEARVVQDADRLDSLGAIGIARCFVVGGLMGRPIYDEAEPFPTQRAPDDRRASVDHFYTKLFKLAATMQTPTGRRMAEERTAVMHDYLDRLAGEIEGRS